MMDMTRALMSESRLDDIFNEVMGNVRDLLNCDRATLFVYDRDTEEMFSRIAHGSNEIRVPVGSGIVGYVAAHPGAPPRRSL